MDPYLGYEIAALVVVAYGVIVALLYRSGRMGPDRTLSLFGPALMIKTRRGLAALDRWGRFRRFWTRVGDLGITLAAIAMVGILALLVVDAILSFRIAPSAAPSVNEALGIPGINPIIPIGYGIVALVVGIVLHELMHGVIARSQGIGVKSIGVLWCVVPVGAFVEQNDADMMAASRRKRDRVAAAGVLANFALALAFFLVLSLVVSTSVAPNANGVGVAYVEPGSPAANISLAPGDILTSINGTATTSEALFESSLANTTPGETVAVDYYSASLGSSQSVEVVLAPSPTVKGRGFLGVAPTFLTPTQLKQTLAWPFGSSSGPLTGGIDWIVLPLATLEPIQGPSAQFFHLTGPFAGANAGAFWIGANLLYWLAWMNLLLGLSNALPLFPLDGGLLFRDFAASMAARVKRGWSAARLDEFGATAAALSSVLVLVLIAWQFIVPRIV
ncbi:MAG TPA: site-2 protease family protein [Thermoplasmata archaeon]|nr:site-2 protease family protein [Thermoplasmata archaeon]